MTDTTPLLVEDCDIEDATVRVTAEGVAEKDGATEVL